MKFRKKPVVIEAVRWTPGEPFKVPKWLVDAMAKPKDEPGGVWENGDNLEIFTLEGVHTALSGDWIIQGVKGELYPIKNDIFEATYEPVQE